MSGYIQFRLSNGDELICQVVEEPGDDDANLVIRNAMMVYKVETSDGTRYHTFRPWMASQISDTYFQLLNYSHIIGEAKPDPVLLEQYYKALERELQTEEEFQEKVEAKYQQTLQRLAELIGGDSDEPNNVVSLFDKDKLH